MEPDRTFKVLDATKGRFVHEAKRSKAGHLRKGPDLTWPNYSLATVAAERLTVSAGRAFFVREVTA